jgi:hypothetical protein
MKIAYFLSVLSGFEELKKTGNTKGAAIFKVWWSKYTSMDNKEFKFAYL